MTNLIRENKNMFLFSFLSALVELDVFVDISVDFMLVGQGFLNVINILLVLHINTPTAIG